MSKNIQFVDLSPMDFTINKRFGTGVNYTYFSLDVRFDGDVHFTNFGRFSSYDEAYEFGCQLTMSPFPSCRYKHPIAMPEEDSQCSEE